MRDVLVLAVHLLVTLARLLRPGGVRAVPAESLLLKHRLLISNRSRRRAPNLTCLLFFWNAVDLARKLEAFRDYYNGHRVHHAIAGPTPAQRAGAPCPAPAALDRYGWQPHCRDLFEPPIAA